jgi:predicted dienelactone hydrolase
MSPPLSKRENGALPKRALKHDARATRIINEVKGINRVVYDVTQSRQAPSSGSDLDSIYIYGYVNGGGTP